MAVVYTYWWFGGALKHPGRTDLPLMISAALPATIPFTI